MITDIKTFSLAESLNDSKGKSSLGLLFGLLYGIAALFMYAIGTVMVLKGILGYTDVYMYAGVLNAASGSLIGVRYFKKDQPLDIQEKKKEIKEEEII